MRPNQREIEARRNSVLRNLARLNSFCRPNEIGASDASYHSKDLNRLCELGLAERRQSGEARTGCLYRITDAGRAHLKQAGL